MLASILASALVVLLLTAAARFAVCFAAFRRVASFCFGTQLANSGRQASSSGSRFSGLRLCIFHSLITGNNAALFNNTGGGLGVDFLRGFSAVAICPFFCQPLSLQTLPAINAPAISKINTSCNQYLSEEQITDSYQHRFCFLKALPPITDAVLPSVDDLRNSYQVAGIFQTPFSHKKPRCGSGGMTF